MREAVAKEDYSHQWRRLYLPLFSLLGVVFLMSLVTDWRWENARADSTFDGIVAVATFTISLLILLGGRYQKENNEGFFAYFFLVSGILRFLTSATESMDITIWLHRICSLTLGFGFLLHWFPFRPSQKKISNRVTLLGLIFFLGLGVTIFVEPAYFPSTFLGNSFSFEVKGISFLSTIFFLFSAYFQLRVHFSQDLSSLSFIITTFLFGYVALVYPYTLVWGGQWWLIQLVELATTTFLSASLLMNQNRRILENKEKLQEVVSQLKRSNLELENFSSIAAHDLTEPLRTISSYCQLMTRNYSTKIDDHGKQYLDLINDGAKRMSELINGLLDYARIGKTRSAFVEVDCTLLLKEILKGFDLTLKDKNAEIVVNPLPRTFANPTFLMELFQNLIENALKYQKPGAVPKIVISGTHKNDENIYSVKDNGIGIKKEDFERIFAMFNRVHSRGEYFGTGIGLATCKKIVELHGGNIWVESQFGQGSTFYFTLPRSY